MCKIIGASSSITPNGKKLRIYYLNNDETSMYGDNPYYIITFNSEGTPSSIQKLTNNNTYVSISSSNLVIPRGQKYKVSLQLWNESLTEEEQAYYRTPDAIYTANKEKRTIVVKYT